MVDTSFEVALGGVDVVKLLLNGFESGIACTKFDNFSFPPLLLTTGIRVFQPVFRAIFVEARSAVCCGFSRLCANGTSIQQPDPTRLGLLSAMR